MHAILLILALLCFVAAALGLTTSRLSFGWLGLAVYMLSLILFK